MKDCKMTDRFFMTGTVCRLYSISLEFDQDQFRGPVFYRLLGHDKVIILFCYRYSGSEGAARG